MQSFWNGTGAIAEREAPFVTATLTGRIGIAGTGARTGSQRHHGPWQGMQRGEIEKLKPEYRLALARDGYALVKCVLAVFKPEA